MVVYVGFGGIWSYAASADVCHDSYHNSYSTTIATTIATMIATCHPANMAQQLRSIVACCRGSELVVAPHHKLHNLVMQLLSEGRRLWWLNGRLTGLTRRQFGVPSLLFLFQLLFRKVLGGQ